MRPSSGLSPGYLLGLVLTVSLFLVALAASREIRGLRLEVMNTSPTMEQWWGMNGDSETTVDGLEKPALRLMQVSVRNVGSVAIRPEDFDTPLRIDVGADIQGATSIAPAGVTHNKILVADSSIEILPVLLNPGERIVLTIAVDASAKVLIQPQARIADIPRVELVSHPVSDRYTPRFLPAPLERLEEIIFVIISISVLFASVLGISMSFLAIMEWKRLDHMVAVAAQLSIVGQTAIVYPLTLWIRDIPVIPQRDIMIPSLAAMIASATAAIWLSRLSRS